MALKTKAIKQKMKSVANIKKITKTMEMISISKMKKAIGRAQASREYAQAVLSLLSYVARQKYLKNNHPLFKRRTTGRRLVVVLASDKSLCGAYNLNIYKALASFKKKYGEEIDCLTVGRYAEHAAVRLKLPIMASFIKLPEQNALTETETLANMLLENFKGNYQSIHLLYTEFIKTSKFKPVAKEILPLNEKIFEDILTEMGTKEEMRKENLALYLFEPSEESILEVAVPRLLASIVYQVYLEGMAAEHTSRMFAMKAASDNAAGLFEDLNLSFNHARQETVTKELSEIVGGATA